MKLMPKISNVIPIHGYDEDEDAGPSTGYWKDDPHAHFLLRQPMIAHRFPVLLGNGTRIDQPHLYCRFCGKTLEPHGRITRFERAALIEAAGQCPDCEDYTVCDARILDTGRLFILDYQYPGEDAYAGKIHVAERADDDEEGDPPETWVFAEDGATEGEAADGATAQPRPPAQQRPVQRRSWVRRLLNL